MRWEMLFADLEASLESSHRAAFDADVADRGRAERAALRLPDRLRAHVGAAIACRLVDRDVVTGRLLDVGADWVLMEDAGSLLVPLDAVVGIDGLGRSARPDPSALARRAGLTVLLRRLARDRCVVRARLLGGSDVVGTIDRVGADHLDLALHEQEEERRPAAVRAVRVVPTAALVLLRSA